MKKFNYKEIKQLFLQVGSKSWADSCMSGRCGVSKKKKTTTIATTISH